MQKPYREKKNHIGNVPVERKSAQTWKGLRDGAISVPSSLSSSSFTQGSAIKSQKLAQAQLGSAPQSQVPHLLFVQTTQRTLSPKHGVLSIICDGRSESYLSPSPLSNTR